MRSLHQVAASEIAVVPYYLKGYQQHGLQYDSQRDSRAQPLGAQCANCHTILWITGRSDPILFKEVNNQESYDDQHERFFTFIASMPKLSSTDL